MGLSPLSSYFFTIFCSSFSSSVGKVIDDESELPVPKNPSSVNLALISASDHLLFILDAFPFPGLIPFFHLIVLFFANKYKRNRNYNYLLYIEL